MSGGSGRRHGQAVTDQVTASLLRHNLPDVEDAEVARAVEHVRRSVAAMPLSNRLAVDAASALVLVVLSAMARAWFPAAAPPAQESAVVRLSALRAPVITEFVKLTRGLGLVAVFEARSVRDGR